MVCEVFSEEPSQLLLVMVREVQRELNAFQITKPTKYHLYLAYLSLLIYLRNPQNQLLGLTWLPLSLSCDLYISE